MKAIVAVDENWAIGYKNQLLFRIPEDLRNFKRITMGHPVILGRNTLETFPNKQPLPGRHNYILSHDTNLRFDDNNDVIVVHDIPTLIKITPHNAFVIGGASVYKQLLPYCDTVFVTKIPRKAPLSDTFFQNLDESDDWTIADISYIPSEYGFLPVVKYVRKQPWIR